MKLIDYLALQSIKQNEFADIIGEKAVCVSRYCLGTRIPRPNVMQKIFLATGGAVTPNDFFLSDALLAQAAGVDAPASSVPKGGIAC